MPRSLILQRGRGSALLSARLLRPWADLVGDDVQRVGDLGSQVVVGDQAVPVDDLACDGQPNAGVLQDVGADVAQHGVEGGVCAAASPFSCHVEPGNRLAVKLPAAQVQSRRFFRLPGKAPAYSGVQNRTASAAARRRASRPPAVGAGRGRDRG